MTNLKYIFFIAIIGLSFACDSQSTDKQRPKKTADALQEKVDAKSETQNYSTHNVSWKEINSLEKVPFDYMVPYGDKELQFGELRTPLTQDTFPLVIRLDARISACRRPRWWLSQYL